MKRNFLKWILSSFITATFLFLIIGSSWALPLPATISIDPLKTYLRTDFPTDKVPASSVIELNSFGINPGDYIRLEQLGFYKRGVASADDFNEMIGVFSTSDLIAPPVNLNRVVGAIDAGVDYVTLFPHNTSIPTDISEDFFIDDIIIKVPTGAQYLIIAANDNRYFDNSDPNGDFAVRISAALPKTIKIDSLNTYIRTDLSPPSPIDGNVPVSDAIELGSIGIHPGDYIRLEQLGFYKRGVAFADDFNEMIGVFSSNNTIAPPANLNRVVGAIDAGDNFTTLVTSQGNLQTDIAEDFRITDIVIQVPVAAQYLIIAANDNFYPDNTDPNGDFAVRISAASGPKVVIDQAWSATFVGGQFFGEFIPGDGLIINDMCTVIGENNIVYNVKQTYTLIDHDKKKFPLGKQKTTKLGPGQHYFVFSDATIPFEAAPGKARIGIKVQLRKSGEILGREFRSIPIYIK